jgi:hypothetical protein
MGMYKTENYLLATIYHRSYDITFELISCALVAGSLVNLHHRAGYKIYVMSNCESTDNYLYFPLSNFFYEMVSL